MKLFPLYDEDPADGGGAPSGDNPDAQSGGAEPAHSTSSGQAAPSTGSGDTASWRDSLPDDLKSDPELQPIEDVTTLAKGYVHAQRMVGRDKVALPGKDATPEEWSQFYSKLGRPESPDAYKVPEGAIPENVQVDEKMVKAFHAKAHELGLTQKQAAELVHWQAHLSGEGLQAQQEAQEQAKQDAIAELKKEWGGAYNERLTLARNALQQFGGDEMVAVMEESGLANNPKVAKFLAEVGKALADDDLIGEAKQTAFGTTPAEAQRKINELYADPEFMKQYLNPVPGHKEAVEQIMALRKLAHPEPEPARP